MTTAIGAMVAKWSKTALANAQGIALIVAIGMLSSADAALGAEPAPSAGATARCEEAQTTAAMRECENERYRRADAGMAAEYKGLMSRLDRVGQAKLRSAQRAWLKFRDAEAGFQADTARGGTLAPLLRVSALADLTESRWQQLSKAAKELGR